MTSQPLLLGSLLVVVVSTGCDVRSFGQLRQFGDQIAMLTATRDDVRVVTNRSVMVCGTGGRADDNFVGVPAYTPTPDCTNYDYDASSQSNESWRLTDRGLLITRADVDPDDVLMCRTSDCRNLFVYDFNTERESALFATPRQLTAPEATKRHFVWIDRSKDSNGLCHFPAGDSDCHVDLVAYDRSTNVERRLTADGTVYPPLGLLGEHSFVTNGTIVVYVDRRRTTNVDCFSAERLDNVLADCPTDLYEVDLNTGDERLRITGTNRVLHPLLDGEVLVWLEVARGSTTDVLEVWTDDGTDLVARRVGEVMFQPGQTFLVEAGWLVYHLESTVYALSIADGHVVTLTDEDEAAGAPVVGGGSVYWTNNAALTSYNLRTGTRRTLMGGS